MSYLETALDIAERRDQVYVAFNGDPAGGWYDLFDDAEDENPFDTVVEDVVLILADQDYGHEGALEAEGLTMTVLDKATSTAWSAPDGA